MSNFKSQHFKFRDSEREVVSVLIENYDYQKREKTVGYYPRLFEKLKEIEDKDNETKLRGIKEFQLLVQERELKRKSLADNYGQ
ncbi:14612_t:CDS:2, partial [Racocetra fulgida]